MLKSTVRFLILPLIAGRTLFLVGGLMIPPALHAAAAPAAAASPAQSPAKAKSAAKKKPSGKKKKEDSKKLTAPALIAEVEKGIAIIGKGAKDAKIDPKSKTAAPFFSALRTVATNMGTLKKQLAAKDKGYFKTLSESATAIGRLRVTAPRIGVANKSINEGAKVVFDSFDALRANFGKEAARKKAGGPLTDQEKATFAKLKTQQTELVAKLTPVRERAVKAGNKKLVADLDGLLKQSRLLASAKDTVAGFVLALELFDYLSGQYDAYTYYIPVDYRTDWAYVGSSFKQADTFYWEYYDSYTVNDWAYYETASVSYEYDYAWNSSISATEVSEYNSYVEESSSEEVSEETYIEESSYGESLETNEDSQDTSWEDTEEEITDDASNDGEDASGESDDASNDGEDASGESDDASNDGEDASGESDDASDDGGDDGGSDDSGGDNGGE